MIAQTVVEYGGLQAISSAFSNAVYRLELFIGAGNSKYLIIVAIAAVVLLIFTRHRTRY